MTRDALSELAKRWESAIVARTAVDRFTGGLISSKSLANADSAGEGPPRLKIGGKVAYRALDLVDWLKARCADAA